jgi:hypothetical protein
MACGLLSNACIGREPRRVVQYLCDASLNRRRQTFDVLMRKMKMVEFA